MSTNVLALMQFVPAGDAPAQVNPRTFSASVRFLSSNKVFNLFGKKAADRSRAPRGEHSGLAYGLPADADRYILFLAGHVGFTFFDMLHVLYVEEPPFAMNIARARPVRGNAMQLFPYFPNPKAPNRFGF